MPKELVYAACLARRPSQRSNFTSDPGPNTLRRMGSSSSSISPQERSEDTLKKDIDILANRRLT